MHSQWGYVVAAYGSAGAVLGVWFAIMGRKVARQRRAGRKGRA